MLDPSALKKAAPMNYSPCKQYSQKCRLDLRNGVSR